MTRIRIPLRPVDCRKLAWLAVLTAALTRLRVAKATLHQAVGSSELAGVLADHTFAVPAVIDDALGASGHSFKRLGMPVEQSLAKRLPDIVYVLSLARRK